MVITWGTSKSAEGYTWRVYAVGYQVETRYLKSGTCATRAQAVGQAKRWTRYLKAQASKTDME